jgi:hypothetical protein
MTRKLMARKHVRALSCRSAVSAESHSDGQNAGYFLRTLRAVLLALGYSEPPLFIRTLCKRLREDAEKLKEEKATLEGMVESRDELIMDIAKETGLDRTGGDAEDEEEDVDADNGGGDSAPPVLVPPAATPEEIVEVEGHVEMVLEQEAPVAHEIILADAEPEMPYPRLYHALMRDYEESPSRMMDALDYLDDPNEGCSDMDEWFSEDGSSDRD